MTVKQAMVTAVLACSVLASAWAGTGDASVPTNQAVNIATKVIVTPSVTISWNDIGSIETWRFDYGVNPVDADGNHAAMKHKGNYVAHYFVSSMNGTNIVNAIEDLGIADGTTALKKLMTALAKAAVIQYKRDNNIEE